MKRKEFIKKSIVGIAASAGISATIKAEDTKESVSTYDQLMEQVGFNHLPNHEIMTAKTILHKANTRGHANHGWLDTHHSFSFANYYNPERMNFGVLRVLNDDIVSGGRGFSKHPHDNMEIISIPLSGGLKHQDTLGSQHVIRKGDVQVMSAGTGIYHSEKNDSSTEEVRFLQIWMFPNRRNVAPRYGQISYDTKALKNNFVQVLSPNQDDGGVWVHQNAWFHLGELDKDFQTTYQWKDKRNGLYAFVLEGNVTIAGQALHKRDGFGIWDTNKTEIRADTDAQLLLMEVPMSI